MSGKRQNIFRAGDDSTFAVSLPILNALLASPDAEPNTVILYLYLVSKAEQPIVRVYTGDVLEDTGMSRPTFIAARAKLIDAGLITAEITGTKGVWKYELRTADGKPIPTFDDYVAFSTLTREQIEAYYSDRLGMSKAPAQTADGNLLFACPFCNHTRSKSKPSLAVSIESGSSHNGRFFCGNNRCARNGGMVWFEQTYADKQGRELTRQQAARAVSSFMINRGAEQVSPQILELMESDLSITL